MIDKQINLGSPKQLQVVLFEELDMPKTKKTKTGYTTDAEALQGLFDKTGHPFLEHLLAHRDATRMKVDRWTVFSRPWPKTVASTRPSTRRLPRPGRLSSTDPNLQNIPVRKRRGARDPRRIRGRAGVRRSAHCRLQPDRNAHHGARVQVTEGLIEAFNTGEDLHTALSAHAHSEFRSKEVTPELRPPGPRRCPYGPWLTD